MKNKKFWIVTSLVTLLPMIAGVLLWDALPERMPTHFGVDGAADGWGSKAFAVFGMPALLFLIHWAAYFATRLDRQNRGHNEKVLNLVALVFPALSVMLSLVIYGFGLGREPEMDRLVLPLLGLLLMLIGNWLPKTRQNSTLGIKLPWTLYNEENWNKTHRVGGFTWVLGGLVFLAMGFVDEALLLWLMPLNVALMAGVPVVYSWNLARKQKAAGTYTESTVSRDLKKHPAILAVSTVLVTLILIGAAVVMFTGALDFSFTETELQVEASFYDDIAIGYEQIDSAEYREDAPDGVRQWGFASARLLLGLFDNEEFGSYTRYTRTGDTGCVVLTCGEEIVVLGAESQEATRLLYEAILERIG